MHRKYVGLLLVGAVIFGGVILFGYMERRSRSREFVMGTMKVSYPNPHDVEDLRKLKEELARPLIGESALQGRWAERQSALSVECERLRRLVDRGESIDASLKGRFLPSGEASELGDELHEITAELLSKTGPLRAGIRELDTEVKAAIFQREEQPQLLASARKNRDSVEGLPGADLKLMLDSAVAAWPKTRSYFEDKWTQVSLLRETLKARMSELEQAGQVSAGEINAAAFRTLAGAIETLQKNIVAQSAALRENVADLDYAISHILKDAEKRGGIPYQELTIMRVARDGTFSSKDVWRLVTEDVFEGDLEHLGMTVYHKPRGRIHGARRFAAPAGFEYVGEDSLGEWLEEGAGGPDVDATWRFRKRAAGLAAILAGGRVLRSHWKAYRKAMAAGKNYFGHGRSRSGTRALQSKPAFKKTRLSRSYALYSAQRTQRRARSSSSSHRGGSSSGYRGSSSRSYGK